ncbi:MAG TPA: fibronectin type III domain-containing protein [Thermoanaerobaculia bacterium]|nr:fibronectin type III domain-containing protein [Thermoanaerobaculia bacterium]
MRNLFLGCTLLIAAGAHAAIPQTQRAALQAIYQSTNGDAWTNKTNWNGAADTECTWHGVTCDEQEANVAHLELYENNLQGTLPAAVASLTKLRSLQVYSNPGLGGPLPVEIAQLAELEAIYASGASFTGTIPKSWGALKNLTNLAFGSNRIEGPLPAELGDLAALRELDLYGNLITGQIPSELGKLTNLETLSLNANRLDGTIPVDLARATKLQRLGLTDNQLTGEIPPQLGDLADLLYLGLSYNELTGGIPPQLGQLRKLEELYLGNNPLGGVLPKELGDATALRLLEATTNGLEGTLPAELFQLTALEELQLGDNAFEGNIPADIGKLASLRVLQLYSNQFDGPIPVAITALAALENLELSGNELTGPIPAEISRLTKLRDFYAYDNQLSGAIPPQLGSITTLETVSLFQNALEGRIPDSLGQLANLRKLELGENQLTGTIPESFRNLKNLRELSLVYNQLSGPLPSWIGELTALEALFLSTNRFSGAIPQSVASLANLYYFDVTRNELTGPLPDFTQLGNLVYITVNENALSGALPASLGALANLTYADFGFNAFTGPLPKGIGNWTKVEYVSFVNNSLDGELPAEIGGLKTAYNLSLWGNRFSGVIPKEIGDLTSLQYLDLAFNAFRGPIPAEITKLTTLLNASSDFSYNALFTSDQTVRAFVNSKQYSNNFEETQTVTPLNVRVTETTDRSATLAWTPITYAYDAGGYQIAVHTSPSGAPVAYATTRSKEIDSITVRNLNPQTTYFFTVSAVTHPHDPQKNLLVSDPSTPQHAATKQRVIAPAEVAVTQSPEGMVQIDGKPVVDDRFALTNFGDVATQLTLEAGGEFFTMQPATFTLAAGGTQVVTLKSIPQPAGTYYGNIVPQGDGVPEGLYLDVILLSQARPAGVVVASPVEPRIEIVGTATQQIGVAQFRNTGTARLTGIVLSDQPWVVPDKQPITIEPGAVGSVNFTIDRARRPAGREGALVANLTLVYVDGTASGIGVPQILGAGSGGVSTSKVTVVDVTTPAVTTGTLPPLAPGEIPLIIPGVVNRSGTRSDVSILNVAGTSSIGDLKLYFTAGPATSIASLLPLAAAQSVSFTNILGNIYSASETAGTLQIRSTGWQSLGTDAKVTTVKPDGGTLAGSVPVFRGDRGIRGGERIYLAGVAKPADLVIQELGGVSATLFIEFLNAAGNAVGSSLTQTVAARSLLELRDAVPAGAVTAIISNTTASSSVLAYARVTDATSGDNWSVVDWSGFYRYPRNAAVRVPFADGRAPGGGKHRAVRHAVTPRSRTDLVLFNTTTAVARATVQSISTSGSVSEKEVVLAPRATLTMIDAGGSGSATTHLVITPAEGEIVVTARSHALSSAGSVGTAIPVLAATDGLRLGQSQAFARLEDSTTATVTAATPATYRTSYGLVETSGVATTVRARIIIDDEHALVSATTTRTFNLSPRQQIFLPELLRSFAGDERDTLFGDLHDLSLEIEVTAGNGSVVPFVIVTDNGTGDSVLRVQ